MCLDSLGVLVGSFFCRRRKVIIHLVQKAMRQSHAIKLIMLFIIVYVWSEQICSSIRRRTDRQLVI